MPLAFCHSWQVSIEPEDVTSYLTSSGVFFEKTSGSGNFAIWVQDSRSVNQPNGCIVEIRKPANPRDDYDMELDGTFKLKLDWDQGRNRSHIDIINGSAYRDIEYSITLSLFARTGRYYTKVKIFVDSLIAGISLEKEVTVTIVVQPSIFGGLAFTSIGVIVNIFLTVFVEKKETRLLYNGIVFVIVFFTAAVLVSTPFSSQFPETLNLPFYHWSLAFSAGFALTSGAERIWPIGKSIMRSLLADRKKPKQGLRQQPTGSPDKVALKKEEAPENS